jgi:hypothetical protein
VRLAPRTLEPFVISAITPSASTGTIRAGEPPTAAEMGVTIDEARVGVSGVADAVAAVASKIVAATARAALTPASSLNEAAIDCRMLHAPYLTRDASRQTEGLNLSRCAMCGAAHVPSVMLATIEPPPSAPVVGAGTLVEARIARVKRDTKAEFNATIVSEVVTVRSVRVC